MHCPRDFRLRGCASMRLILLLAGVAFAPQSAGADWPVGEPPRQFPPEESDERGSDAIVNDLPPSIRRNVEAGERLLDRVEKRWREELEDADN